MKRSLPGIAHSIAASSWLLLLLAFAIFCPPSSARAEIRLPHVFGSHMVLQRDKPLIIWGWATPGETVTVQLGAASQTAHANDRGEWKVTLPAMTQGGPYTLTVSGSSTVKYDDVMIGEVWLCSGQSNMEFGLGRVKNAKEEVAAANHPGIRLLMVENRWTPLPQDDMEGTWKVCTPQTVAEGGWNGFSAAGYFFGREIHTNLNVPVGLIESSWGGTRIEPWTPKQGFESVHSLARLATPVAKSTPIHSTTPMGIYNAMIAPMAGFAIRGALWYQGESNCAGTGDDNAYLTYPDKMAALIGGWRMNWGEGNFPFYFVQIAPYRYFGRDKNVPSAERLPEFWAVQSRAEHTIKNTGMVATTDLVDDLDDIHPRNKQDVGHRLALLARHQTYGEKNVVASGPVFKQMKIEGNKAFLTFDHVDGGLMSRDGQPLTWFGIAGHDGRFVDGDAKIVGDTLEVSSDDIDKPEAVRFAWRETAQPNFCNKAGLPAEPFTTEDPSQWH
ncbi:MAG TPA: sialate O-acetylesterase [Verrucomicrobiae bacterium]